MSATSKVEAGALARAKATTLSYAVADSLPAGVTFKRASQAWKRDGDTITAVAANVPRFGRTQPRTDLPVGLLLEPASTNYARNASWASAVVASDPNAFNGNGTAAGAWGTLPTQNLLVQPAAGGGATFGWQIAAKGTLADGTPYLDIRFRIHNPLPVVAGQPSANKLFYRLIWSLFAGVPAAAAETWSMGCDLAIVAGDLPPGSNVQLTFRPVNQGSSVDLATIGANVTGELRRFEATSTLPAGLPITGLGCGITVSCAPQQNLDVTIRMARPQFERSSAPTSYIPTTNTGYITRAAESLTFAREGTWYIRLSSHWRNFDLVATAIAGVLSVELPEEARLAGITTFQQVQLSSQPFAPDRKRLTYAPPPMLNPLEVLVSPTTSALPAASAIDPLTGELYGEDAVYPPDLDIIVVVPEKHLLPLKVNGGRNVVMIGAHIAPADAPPNHFRTRSNLAFIGTAGVIHVEGCHIDGYGLIQRDGINIDGRSPKTGVLYEPVLQLQNTLIDNIHGEAEDQVTRPDGTIGNHSDVIQAFGRCGGLRVHRNTARTNYQGFFLVFFDERMRGPVDITETDVGHKAWDVVPSVQLTFPNMYWFNRTVPREATGPYPRITLNQVYGIPKEGNEFTTNGTFPSSVASNTAVPDGFLATVGEGGITLAWTHPIQNITGCVRKGLPPGGSFVTPERCGIGYKSPGYGYVA